MKFPKEYLEEIKQRVKVSDIVGATVQLKRRGREFVGLSPFSKEKTPSFTINDEKGFYHCFSSGEHGNIFDFLVKVEKLNFGDAVRKLAAKAGMPVFKFTKENIEVENKRKKYDEILTIAGKQERETKLDEVNASVKEKLAATFEGREKEVSAALRSVTKKLVRQRVLREKIRIDGRGIRDIRAITAEVEVMPRVHGSAIFERGETQILGVTTLNMLKMEQQLDTLSPENHKRYMHNYNFPPYSVGETGRVGSPKRREIGQ